MKKIKFLIFILPLFLIFTSQVKADTFEDYGVMSVTTDIWVQGNQVNVNNTLNGAVINVPSNTIPYIQFYPSLQGDPYTFSSALKGQRLSLTATVCTTGNINLLRVNYSSGTFPYGDLKLVTSSSTKVSSCTINGYTGDLIQLKAVLSIESFTTDEDRGVDLAEGYTKFEYNKASYVSLWRMDTFSVDLYNETNSQNDTIINQNNTIINQNEQMIQQQQETNDKLDETNKELGELNDNITNDDISGAEDSASSFFDNFEDNDFGLSDIITIPLDLISSITSKSCNVLTLNIPFVNKTLTLPCMNSIYEEYFGSFLSIYQTITFGIIAYWVCVQIYAMVKGFKNPDKDEIEVLDL